MNDDLATADDLMDRLLPERLSRLQRVGGLPVVFGGAIKRGGSGAASLVISRLAGTVGTSLRGLNVPSGTGLGGAVLQERAAKKVENYASTTSITHQYDRVVVNEEKLTSVLAVPLIIGGAVRGVMYGAVRAPEPLGDRALKAATTIAGQLQRDIEELLKPRPRDRVGQNASARALEDHAAVIAPASDATLRARLSQIPRDLGGVSTTAPADVARLAPREVEVLRLVAHGASNLEIASELGLTTETIKAYLRSAMRRLGVHNRTAAVHTARALGAI